jgi:hypothetical protein
MLYLSNVRAACCWRTSRRLRSRSAAPPPRRCVTPLGLNWAELN